MNAKREVYRTFRRSRGFSNHVDAGTGHRDADATCWWCAKPVLRLAHDFSVCHEGMFYEVVQYRRQRPDAPAVDAPPTLFDEAAS